MSAFASNASGPTVTFTGGSPVLGGVSTSITMTVSNPTANQYSITGFTINAPSGWTITNCSAGGFLVVCTNSASSVTYSVSQFVLGSAAGIAPGASDSLSFTASAATASSYPYTSTFTSKVQDASNVAFYNGPSFSLQVIDPTTTITSVTPAASANYAAGSAALTETAVISPVQAGVPIVFSAPGYTSSTFSFTPKTAVTDSTGTAKTTFQPSNKAGDATKVGATVGTTSITASSTGTITTIAGAPTKMTWTLGSSASNGNHYITAEGTTVNQGGSTTAYTGALLDTTATFSLADKFGNPVSFSAPGLTAWTVTVTALSGQGKFDALGLPSIITCINGGTTWKSGSTNLTPTIACPTGSGATLPFDYFQSPTYNAIGELSATITGTYSGSSFAGAGQSGLLITSTFAGASPVPVVIAPSGATLPNVPAGSKVNVTATLTPPSTCGSSGSDPCPPQPGVPVQLYVDKATSYESTPGTKDYSTSATFTNGAQSTTVTTNSNGQASSLFTLDTCANLPACPNGAHAFFQSNVTSITDTSPPNSLGISADTAAAVITIPGKPTTFNILVTYDNGFAYPATKAATGATLYLDITISDAYGNSATNTAITQIQIGLTTSCGTSCPLSATNVYIPSGKSDTAGSFGPITWTMPSTTGTTATVTATGVLSGATKSDTASVGIVSPLPTLAITSPTPKGGVIYSSNTNVVFSGEVNASIGYASTGPQTVNIDNVTYKIDNNTVQSAPISTGNKITFSVAATFTTGLHHITFNATDSLGNTVTGQTYSVLVDTATPTVKFTTADNASLGYRATVTATIVVAQGDLNSSTVVATFNGTALHASQVSISPTNKLGSNVTYTVTISGLPAGTDELGLNASSLAGLTGTATGITVHVSLAFAQSVIINTATYGTLGSYNGISVSATNAWSTSQNLVVFAVWKNSAGQTVAVTTGGLTLASGATGTAFAPLAGALPSGTYSVSVFVITTGNNPVSSTTSISVAA